MSPVSDDVGSSVEGTVETVPSSVARMPLDGGGDVDG
jgi:hypothetical protein